MPLDASNMPITDEDLAALIRQEISVALGSDQDDLTGYRAEALDYYYGRRPGKMPEGRSSAISNDVADMTEALLAQIMPTFTGDEIATFEAQSPQDEQQAQLETDLVNYQIMERCDGYQVFYESVKNGLLLRNGINKVYVEEFQRVKKEQYPPLDEVALMVLQAESPDQQIYAEDNEAGTVVTRLVTIRRLKIVSVDPSNFVITSDHTSTDLTECRFCGEQCVETEGSLIEQGYDPLMVADLPSYDRDVEVDQLARNQSHDEDEHYWYEKSSRPILIWECYITLDRDGDGYPELHKVVWGGNDTILSDELVDWIPYACGTPFIAPHRWQGISLFDKLKEISNQKTEFLRQWIDNTRHHNNRRLEAVEKQVNLEDVVDSRPGGVVRVKAPGMLREIQTSDIGPTCFNALEYLDKQRSERAGASLDMQAKGLPSGDATAHGVERQMAFKEQMAGLITRTLAETLIKQTYLLVHRTMKTFFGGQEISARKGGLWRTSDPQTWGEREHVSINVGMSQGERQRQAGALQQVLAMQEKAMQYGFNGVLTDASRIYNAEVDFCRLAGLDNPEQYWINPASPESQQAAQRNAMSAQQQAAEAQRVQAAVIQSENAKTMQKENESLRDYEYKVGKALLDSELEQAKLTNDTEELDTEQEVFRATR